MTPRRKGECAALRDDARKSSLSHGVQKSKLTMSKALATKNVAAVLLGLALVFGFAFAFATPAKADVISDLQAQIQSLLAQISALQTSSTTGGGA